MNNFLRTVRTALRLRLTILAIVLSSLIVALSWGVSISAVYPFVEVVFQGHSMHDWIDIRMAKSEENLREIQGNIKRLKSTTAADSSERELAVQERKLREERRSLNIYTHLNPYIRRYLPDTALQTVILLVVFIFVGTLIKAAFIVANLFFFESMIC